MPGAELLEGGSLFIHALQPSHGGDYTCLAANDVGSVSLTTTLVVHGTARGKGAPAWSHPGGWDAPRGASAPCPQMGRAVGVVGTGSRAKLLRRVCVLSGEKRGSQMPPCLVTALASPQAPRR